MNRKLHIVLNAPSFGLSAVRVPGGLLLITEIERESGNGIALGVASSFVPMTPDEIETFLASRDD